MDGESVRQIATLDVEYVRQIAILILDVFCTRQGGRPTGPEWFLARSNKKDFTVKYSRIEDSN